MKKIIRVEWMLAAALAVAGAASFAQSGGEATYKAKCQMCHGPNGTPSAGMAKMGIKAANDAEMKKLTVDQIAGVVKNGKGKMKPVAGLTDAQVKDVAAYFHSLK